MTWITPSHISFIPPLFHAIADIPWNKVCQTDRLTDVFIQSFIPSVSPFFIPPLFHLYSMAPKKVFQKGWHFTTELNSLRLMPRHGFEAALEHFLVSLYSIFIPLYSILYSTFIPPLFLPLFHGIKEGIKGNKGSSRKPIAAFPASGAASEGPPRTQKKHFQGVWISDRRWGGSRVSGEGNGPARAFNISRCT